MLIKRIVCIGIVFLVLVSIGCGNRNAETTQNSGAETNAVQLNLWHIMNYSGPREIIDDAVKRFEAANPDVSVNVEVFENDAYKTKLAVEIASGTPPDVFFTWGGGNLKEYAEAGRVLNLNEYLDNREGQRFVKSALDLCSVNGNIYALPLDLAAVVLYYNAEIFAEFDLRPPQTYEDLLQLSKVLREKGIVPFALGNKDQWPGAFYYIYLAARQGGAPLFFTTASKKAGAGWRDPAFIEAGEKLQKLIAANAFSTGFNGLDVGQARAQFLNEQAAMYLMGNWLVARIKTEKPEFLEKLALQPFPTIKDGQGDADTVVGGVNCAFAISADCEAPEKAAKLLEFLTDDTTAQAWCRVGRMPAIRVSDEDLAELPPATRESFEFLNKAKYMQPYYDQYLPPRLAEVHKKTTQEIFAGTLAPEAAAEKMAAAAKLH